MSEEMYPEIDTVVGAVVVGYNESNCLKCKAQCSS